MKKLLYLLAIISASASAQKKIKTLEVSDTIMSASVDRAGDLYVLSKYGHFQKFDLDGHLIILYKDKRVPTFFDPRDGARLFAYYRDIQHYDWLTPSFEPVASFRIDSSFVIQPWLICPTGDSKLWVLDEADHSLKKLNPKDAEVEVEVVVDSTLIADATQFIRMREYQNFVFLLHPTKGIFIFNNLGKHIKTLEVSGLKDFHFLGEELYYNAGSRVKFFDLFTAESREIVLDNIQGHIILTDQRLFVAHPKSVDIYEFKP
jgi:hypothetical protein